MEFRTAGCLGRAIRGILHGSSGALAPHRLVRSVQPLKGLMNSKVSLGEMSRLLPQRGRKSIIAPGGVLIKWPAVDGWLAVADEAVRTAYASHCAALALEQHAEYQDIAHFLKRRADMLLKLVDTLAAESRCEDRIRAMNVEDVLTGMKQAEERLSGRVKNLLAAKGQKLPMVKLLEQEYFFSQASQAQLKLAQMEKE